MPDVAGVSARRYVSTELPKNSAPAPRIYTRISAFPSRTPASACGQFCDTSHNQDGDRTVRTPPGIIVTSFASLSEHK